MNQSAWRQTTITFPDPHTSEEVAIAHLAPILAEAETSQLITAWFFIRKDAWRLRYLPTTPDCGDYVTERLSDLHQARHINAVIPGVYEPEVHAFGGAPAMDAAHRLWHHDSRHLLTPAADSSLGHQRELSIMLAAAMIRAAGLDWYEHGDVWARVADHRDPPPPAAVNKMLSPVKRLLTVDPASLALDGAALAATRRWFAAYTDTGNTLNNLSQTGQLHRGLRETLAHHVIFMWNRRSIPGLHQAAIATAAKTIVFGPDPTQAVRIDGGS